MLKILRKWCKQLINRVFRNFLKIAKPIIQTCFFRDPTIIIVTMSNYENCNYQYWKKIWKLTRIKISPNCYNQFLSNLRSAHMAKWVKRSKFALRYAGLSLTLMHSFFLKLQKKRSVLKILQNRLMNYEYHWHFTCVSWNNVIRFENVTICSDHDVGKTFLLRVQVNYFSNNQMPQMCHSSYRIMSLRRYSNRDSIDI